MNAFWKQTLEAAVWTFLETFLATLTPAIAGTVIGDWNHLLGVAGSAGLAGVAAVLSFVKSVIVKNLGNPDSPLISGGEAVG